LGPARPDQITVEAREALAGAHERGHRIYGLAHARDVAAAVVPGLTARSLDYLYTLSSVDRPTAYRDLAKMLVRRAFEDHIDVVYVVAGSPLFINDAVMLIRRRCAERRLPLRLIHGLSFVEVVLERVFWTGHRGLQLYSAWNIARDDLALDVRAPALLCQLGEFSSGADALEAEGSVVMLAALRKRLREWYPADHPVVVLYSSGRPDYRSLARALPLSQIAEQPVPVYSNLWIPSLELAAHEVSSPEEAAASLIAPPSDGLSA